MKCSSLIKFTLLCLLTFSSAFISAINAQTKAPPANIIMVIGDGMGPAYMTAHRYLHRDQQSTYIQPTVFDRHLVGLSSTYPHPVSGLLTDSAASATALASGIKTYNKAIGVDINKQPVITVAAQAKAQGKKVGLVVTAPITDATPAAYFTHHESRKSYNDIADSYLKLLINNKLDIALGGGSRYFLREDKNLVSQLKAQGGHFIDNYSQLTSLPKKQSVLGLFAEVDLPKAIDDVNSQRLLHMTQAAIKHLENDQGYFLLVEASLIDWAGHDKDIVGAMSEMQDLDNTLTWLESYVQSSPNTTVVITADHNTGGLTLSSKNKIWRPELINNIEQSPAKMAHEYLHATEITDVFNLELTDRQIERFTWIKEDDKAHHVDVKKTQVKLFNALVSLINHKTHTGWTTGGHTSVDVPVMAMGENVDLFRGMQDNTDLAKKIFSLLKADAHRQ